jgi:hypothetical protein
LHYIIIIIIVVVIIIIVIIIIIIGGPGSHPDSEGRNTVNIVKTISLGPSILQPSPQLLYGYMSCVDLLKMEANPVLNPTALTTGMFP